MAAPAPASAWTIRDERRQRFTAALIDRAAQRQATPGWVDVSAEARSRSRNVPAWLADEVHLLHRLVNADRYAAGRRPINVAWLWLAEERSTGCGWAEKFASAAAELVEAPDADLSWFEVRDPDGAPVAMFMHAYSAEAAAFDGRTAFHVADVDGTLVARALART